MGRMGKESPVFPLNILSACRSVQVFSVFQLAARLNLKNAREVSNLIIAKDTLSADSVRSTVICGTRHDLRKNVEVEKFQEMHGSEIVKLLDFLFRGSILFVAAT